MPSSISFSVTLSEDEAAPRSAGCQTEIAAKIRSKEADYVLAVKENRSTLHNEIREYFRFLDEKRGEKELPEDLWESGLGKDRGRLERRRVRTACDISFLSGRT